ncbi:hypothetical protein [Candidatus Parabeggiatoa sp. HSG14]|uniref:hypothetical protein n=1 Tax=Candidatus Parabeggiatoa sp. HSG14 TaxID=3055593 RepID=UPI0025A81209|nr:hypothetical protein [Thiotrichales bacterium HSG14]
MKKYVLPALISLALTSPGVLAENTLEFPAVPPSAPPAMSTSDAGTMPQHFEMMEKQMAQQQEMMEKQRVQQQEMMQKRMAQQQEMMEKQRVQHQEMMQKRMAQQQEMMQEQEAFMKEMKALREKMHQTQDTEEQQQLREQMQQKAQQMQQKMWEKGSMMPGRTFNGPYRKGPGYNGRHGPWGWGGPGQANEANPNRDGYGPSRSFAPYGEHGGPNGFGPGMFNKGMIQRGHHTQVEQRLANIEKLLQKIVDLLDKKKQ